MKLYYFFKKLTFKVKKGTNKHLALVANNGINTYHNEFRYL